MFCNKIYFVLIVDLHCLAIPLMTETPSSSTHTASALVLPPFLDPRNFLVL